MSQQAIRRSKAPAQRAGSGWAGALSGLLGCIGLAFKGQGWLILRPRAAKWKKNKTKQHTTAWVRWGCSLATAKRSVFCVALCLEASASTHSSQRKHLCLGRQREGRGWVGQAFTHLALGCHLLANRLL